jgi:hypothetical protein
MKMAWIILAAFAVAFSGSEARAQSFNETCSLPSAVNVTAKTVTVTSPSCQLAGGVVNGVCGSANGVAVSSAPTTNLCSAGTATAVSGSGPWTWSCDGSGGGTNANCSAPLASGPTVPPILATLNPGVNYTLAVYDNFTADTSLNSTLWGTGNCCSINANENISNSSPNLTFSSTTGLGLTVTQSGSTYTGPSLYLKPNSALHTSSDSSGLFTPNGVYIQSTVQASPDFFGWWLNSSDPDSFVQIPGQPQTEIDIIQTFYGQNPDINETDVVNWATGNDTSKNIDVTNEYTAFNTYGFYYGTTSMAFVINGSVVLSYNYSSLPLDVMSGFPYGVGEMYFLMQNGVCGGTYCGNQEVFPGTAYLKDFQVWEPQS